VKDACGKIPDVSLVSPVQSMKARKVLKHDWKLISFSWSPDQRHVITGGDNGSAIIWDAFTSQKKCVIETNCGKVLTVSYGPSTTIVACGGLNKKCSIYKLTEGVEVIKRPKMDVAIHRSYITDSVFLGSDQQLLTSSADGRIYLWDMENDAPVQEFIGHKSEVMSIATQQSDPYSVFASCGNDQSARLWDVRAGKCVKNFDEHNSEVNSVKFFPTGAAIATADNSGVVGFIYNSLRNGRCMLRQAAAIPGHSLHKL
jgi:guanine nucleotide-binding protein subunit beta-5